MPSQGPLRKIEDVSLTADCGCCSIKFSRDYQKLSQARLTIRTIAAYASEDHCRQLIDALATVLESGIEFVAVYDFRDFQIPEMRFARSLAAFCDAHAAAWERNLKIMAMLVKDNLWASVAKGFIAMFTKMCPPHCAYIICHSEDAAEQFFISKLLGPQQSTSGLGQKSQSNFSVSSFVSVEDLMELRNANAHTASKPSNGYRPASLKLPRNLGSSVRLCELSNGDVQVIQSGSIDCAGSTAGSGFGSHKSFQSASFKSITSLESLASMSSLPHLCSRSALQQLGAAHNAYFCVDELMCDALEDSEDRRSSLSFLDRVVEQLDMWLKRIVKVFPCGCTSR